MSFFKHIKKTNESESSKTLAKSKVLKVLGAAGLAFFMGGTALVGALAAPTTASAAGNANTTINQEDPFGLDPQNDKVIADLGGLEIRYHNLGVWDADEGFTYVTMGTRNFIIIACHSAMKMDQWRPNPRPDVVQGETNYWNLGDGTPASNTILMEYMNISSAKTSEKIDSELKPGQMLCISTKNEGTTYFSTSIGNGVTYGNSSLLTHCTNIYNTFTDRQKSFIAPVTLNSLRQDGTLETLTDQYVFPLACGDQYRENFHAWNYLNDNTWKRINEEFLSRSKYPSDRYSYTVTGPTTYSSHYLHSVSQYLKPTRCSFVLQI